MTIVAIGLPTATNKDLQRPPEIAMVSPPHNPNDEFPPDHGAETGSVSPESHGSHADDPVAPARRMVEGYVRFTEEGQLGRGGNATVYRSFDPVIRRCVAVKRLRRTATDAVRERFVREAQVTGQLEHPNIVPVHELGLDRDDTPYLALKEISGDNLRARLNLPENGVRPVVWSGVAVPLLEILMKVCDAIGYAHSRGVLHRDLKPSNVMLGPHGEVAVTDWGLAAASRTQPSPLDSNEIPMRPVTVGTGDPLPPAEDDGSLIGTPAYMSPEQARGDHHLIDERTDVFAIGALLYHMLTGQPPYDAQTPMEAVSRAAKRDLLRPRHRAPKRRIPAELEAICLRAMAATPADRYATPGEFKQEILDHLGNRPVAAYPGGLAEKLVKSMRRNPARGLGIAAVALVALLVTGFSYYINDAEMRAKMERDRLEMDAVIAAAEVRDQKLRRLAKANEFERMMQELGVTIAAYRSRTIAEFGEGLRKARAEGLTVEQYVDSLPDDRLAVYAEAYDERLRDESVEPTADDCFFHGILFHRGFGSVDVAVRCYRHAIKMQEDYAEAWRNLGQAYLDLGERDAALEAFTSAIESDGGMITAWLERGRAYHEAGRFDDARSDINEAITRAQRLHETADTATTKRRLAEAYVARATLALNFGPIEWDLPDTPATRHTASLLEAQQDANHALELVPTLPAARVVLGRIAIERGRPSEAVQAFTAILGDDPTNVGALTNRAAAYLSLNQPTAARRDTQRATELSPNDWSAWWLHGIALGKTAAVEAHGSEGSGEPTVTIDDAREALLVARSLAPAYARNTIDATEVMIITESNLGPTG